MASLENLNDFRKQFNANLYELEECYILITGISENSSDLNETEYALALGKIQYIIINELCDISYM